MPLPDANAVRPSAAAFGEWMAILRQRGEAAGDFDPVIASGALIPSRRLATRDARHFSRIEDLGVRNRSAPFPTG